MLGASDVSLSIVMAIKIKGRVSFTKNRGLNLTLSIAVIEFEGFEDPFSCRRIR